MDIWNRIAKLEAMMAANRRQARYAEIVSRTDAEVAAANAELSHPEKLAGEVYLGNFNSEGFAAIGWKTKRRGQIPRDRQLNRLGSPGFNFVDADGMLYDTSYWPVFASREEIEAAGVGHHFNDIGNSIA